VKKSKKSIKRIFTDTQNEKDFWLKSQKYQDGWMIACAKTQKKNLSISRRFN
jgi:hypothetical protein